MNVVTYKKKKYVRFKNIFVGECFLYYGRVYIKIEKCFIAHDMENASILVARDSMEAMNAVNLSNGTLSFINDDLCVVPVNDNDVELRVPIEDDGIDD